MREKRKDYLRILIGTGLMAVSANLFFTPAQMVPGGFTGLAIIIKYLTEGIAEGGVPVWLSNLILNVPLILFSVKMRGWKFVGRTLAASLAYSAWLFVIPEIPVAGSDLFLTAAAGGAFMGAGLGAVFLGKATTGGTDTLAAAIQRLMPHIRVAWIMQVLDAGIILLAIWIFGIRVSLYAIFAVILSGRIADAITSGFRNASLAYIISDRYEEITEEILREIDRGVTRLEGTGMYTNESRPVLFCAVSRKQTAALKEIVARTDPEAFLIITDAQEVRGEGFLGYTKEEI